MGLCLSVVEERLGLVKQCLLRLSAENRKSYLVVLARHKYSFANVPIEQHLHLALRFILDALVRSEHRVASLAARKRDWCELDDPELSFLHLRRIRADVTSYGPVQGDPTVRLVQVTN